MKKPYNIILKLLLQLLVILVIVELLLRVIFYQQVGNEKLAIIQTLRRVHQKMLQPRAADYYQFHYLARPDSSREVNRQIADEAFASNGFEYFPWVEYKNIDFQGKYIHSSGLIRNTSPTVYANPLKKDTQLVYFFGGSTMFGTSVTDRETIAASFIDQYAKYYPEGSSVKIVNYGVPAYYSYNELILFAKLIYDGKKPAFAVFFDGLNDFLILRAARERLPYFYYSLKTAGSNQVDFKALSGKNDSTETLFDLPKGINPEKYRDTLVENYMTNMRFIRQLAEVNKVQTFVFIQPNPFYHYNNKKMDPVCEKGDNWMVEKGYDLLRGKIDSIPGCYFLGDMLVNEKGYPFIDRYHYSPAMSQKIAAEILKQLGPRLANKD